MENTKIYPEWVQKHRTKGMTVKKVGNSYYLYKRTSKRVPGKKYPQAVDTYIGIITPDGVVKSGKKKLELTNLEVKEYGFSKAVWSLCPDDWKQYLGDDWEDVLAIIITRWSPRSYLAKERTIRSEEDFRYQFKAQAKSLKTKIYLKYNVTVDDDLRALDDVYLIYMEKGAVVSKLSDEQKALVDRLSIPMEV